MSDDKLNDLAARIDRFEKSRPPRATIRKTPASLVKAVITPREKAIRRWVLAAILGWCGLIYAWIVVLRWGQASVWELVLGPVFALLCALICYGFFLFYAELFKLIWRKLRPRHDGR